MCLFTFICSFYLLSTCFCTMMCRFSTYKINAKTRLSSFLCNSTLKAMKPIKVHFTAVLDAGNKTHCSQKNSSKLVNINHVFALFCFHGKSNKYTHFVGSGFFAARESLNVMSTLMRCPIDSPRALQP